MVSYGEIFDMNKNEMAQFQGDLRDLVGESYTVKVDKNLSQQERDELTAHVRRTVGDNNATILIVEPVIEPKFDFNFDLVASKAKEIQTLPHTSEVIESPKPIYSDKWLVMQNRLLNAISNLDLNERRLIMFLSPLVRKHVENDPDARKRVFTVNALDFAGEYNLGKKSIYRTLAEVADSLLHKAFFFWNFKNNERTHRTGVSWLVECDYKENEGYLEIILADTVIEMLSVFDRKNLFTKWERHWIVNLGSYGMVLFELIASCMFQKHKSKTYTVEFLREKFNCLESYSRNIDFKRYVLDKAISDIHAHTPYRITYTQKKKGRVVNEIVFSFEDTSMTKKQNLKQTNASIKTNSHKNSLIPKRQKLHKSALTDAQIRKLAVHKDLFVQANQHLIVDKTLSYYQVFESFKKDLQDPNKISQFHQVGEYLSLKAKENIPSLPKTEQDTRQKKPAYIAEPLTADEIKRIVNNKEFQADYSGKYKSKGKEGSPEHIEFLTFRLQASPSEFTKKPLSRYL